MGITVELLMANDGDIASLVRNPKNARAFIKANRSNTQSNQTQSMGIRYIFDEVDYVLRAGRPVGQLPLGFLQADGHIIGKVKRMVRLRVGDEIVQYPEYENEADYGPPHAFSSELVAQIAKAVSAVDDDWVRRAYSPNDLIPTATREAPDFNLDRHTKEHVEFCQEALRALRPFLASASNAGMGLIRYIW